MKKKIKRNGFSLVELLAAIVILGILSTIGIVTVLNIREKQRTEFNNSQNAIFVETARAYFTDNKLLLPKQPIGSEYVTLKELIEKNYLDDTFLDYDKKPYDKESSKVTVQRLCDGGYSYSGELVTSSGIIIESKDTTGNIKFTINNVNNNIGKVGTKYYTNNNPRIKFKISDDDFIGAFEYSIYKDGKMYKKSQYTCIDKTKEYTETITLDINSYQDGEYKVRVKTYDYIGGVNTNTSDVIVIDTQAPTCEVKFTGTLGENNWYTSNVNVKINASDKNTSGLKSGISTSSTASYEKQTANQIDTKGTTWYGHIKDAAGNTVMCSNFVKVDTKKPQVTQLSISSNNQYYHTLDTIVTFVITDDNEVKYDILNAKPDNTNINKYNDMNNAVKSPQINAVNWSVGQSYDGTTKDVYVIVKDEAGNKSSEAKISYEVYQKCRDKTITSTTYGVCSATCDSGTRSKTTTYTDKYFTNESCPTTTETVSCDPLPACCSPVSIFYVDAACPVTCGTGTYNRYAYSIYNNSIRCSAYDSVGTCTMPDCCSSTYTVEGNWNTCKRRGSNKLPNQERTIKTYSTFNNQVCSSTTETRTCSVSSHTHVWNARGDHIQNSPYAWDCSRGHRGHVQHYNIYCSVCGIKRTESPTYVCPTNPFTAADGWVVVDD